MGSVTLRYFCYGCLFTSVTWSVLLFLYFSLSQDSGRPSFRNVPIQGPQAKRFQSRFTRSPGGGHEQGIKAVPAARGNKKADLSPEMGK